MERQEIKQENKQENYSVFYTVDVWHIIKSLWKRAWVIVACGFLAAVIGFCYSTFFITPTYSSHIKLYVNNSSFSLAGSSFSITTSELTAAQGLVKTYGEILDSRSTLQRVIDKAGVDYTWKELAGMIKYEPANYTEIMRVTVTSTDPYEACNIANTIAQVLPVRIAEIIDGATMEVVDAAAPELDKVAPSITYYTTFALMLGLILSAGVVVILALIDDTIHDEEYVLQTCDYPILGKVPNLLDGGNKSYSYYYRKRNKTKAQGKDGEL